MTKQRPLHKAQINNALFTKLELQNALRTYENGCSRKPLDASSFHQFPKMSLSGEKRTYVMHF